LQAQPLDFLIGDRRARIGQQDQLQPLVDVGVGDDVAVDDRRRLADLGIERAEDGDVLRKASPVVLAVGATLVSSSSSADCACTAIAQAAPANTSNALLHRPASCVLRPRPWGALR